MGYLRSRSRQTNSSFGTKQLKTSIPKIIVALLISTACSSGIAQELNTLRFTSPQGTNMLPEKVLSTLRDAYTELGVSIEITAVPPKREILMLQNGESDGLLVRADLFGKKLSNAAIVPYPLLKLEVVALSQRDKHYEISDWKSLQNRSVGYILGMEIAEANLRKSDHNNFKPYGWRQLFLMLEKHRIDIAISERRVAKKYLASGEFTNIKVLSPALETVHMYHFLHKKHANLIPSLVEILTKQLN